MVSSRRRWRVVLGGIAAVVVLGWLASLAAVIIWSHRDGARPAEAIVVMGAAQYAGHPSPVLRARLDHAIALWHRGLAPRLILTGGKGEGDTTSEAAVGRRYALSHGVPDTAILLESHGRTTRESMTAVAELLRPLASNRVILVSDPFHMLRLWIVARRDGLTPFPSPTRTSPISSSRSEHWKYVLGESVKAPLAVIAPRE